MGENFVSSHLRPSPNELEEALRNERQKWRIFRIQQVRAQAREQAQRVRTAVHTKEDHLLEVLREDLRQQWEAGREKRVQELQQEHHDCLQAIGHAHRLAQMEPDAEKVLRERRQQNREAAKKRGCEAGKVAKEIANHLQHEHGRVQRWRQDALAKEKLRAARIANLPTPEVFHPKIPEAETKVPRVQFHEAGTFTTSTYIPRNVRVEKEIWSTEPDGRVAAEREMAVMAEHEAAKGKAREEEARKREERGQEALARERVVRLADHLITGLDHAQQKHSLSSFLNPHHLSLLEMNKKRMKEQRQMERAVEQVLKEPQPSTPDLPPHLSPDTSDGLETIDSSAMETEGQMPDTKVHDLTSFLEQMKRRRDQLLQEIYSSVSEEETSIEEGEKDTRRPETKISQDGQRFTEPVDPHLAETVPVDELPRYQQDESGVRTEERKGGMPTAADDVMLSSSSVPLIQEGSSSGLGSSEYMSPPSSLPSRREFARDESVGKQDLNDDIHLAETVPVDRLPHYSQGKYTTTHHTALTGSEDETFQESSSDDIHIKIELSAGSGSTLKTVTPVDESFPRPASPVPQSSSGASSTDYISPPSSLPVDQFSSREVQKKLQRIQEQRKKVQQLIDSMSSTAQQRTSDVSSTHSTYFQKLKGEGSGQRPRKRKKKYEMQKRILLQYYLQKLLHMKGEELENISASTVESSGLSISSLSSLVDYLELDAVESSVTPSPPASITTPDSCLTSIYTDIDQVPVKLSSLSTSEEITSTNNSSDRGRDDGIRSYSEHLSSSPHNIGPETPFKQHHLHSKEKVESASSEVSPVLSSHSSDRKDESYVMHQQIQDVLSALQRVTQNLKEKEGEMLDKSSSLLEPDALSRVSPLPPDNLTTTTEASLSRKMPQSFGGRRLSTIHEVTSDLTESHISLSGSADYHTPSREYESSLGASSDVSVARVHTAPPPQVFPLARLQAETSSEEELRMSPSRKKYLRRHQHLTINYKKKHQEYAEKEGTKGKRDDQKIKANNSGSHSPVLLPEAATSSLEKARTGKRHPVSSSVDDTVHTSISDEKAGIMSDITCTSHGTDHRGRHEKSVESSLQNRTVDQAGDTSRHSLGESTLTSSLEQSQQRHTAYSSSSPPHHSSCTSPPPDRSHSSLLPLVPLTPALPRPAVERAAGEKGSSESITSIPDIAEVLQRFGLDWAGSMIRKMDRAEQRTSSDTSSGHLA